jgi:hypothetical protein
VNFHPPPVNDFAAFMREYYGRCRERVPHIRAVAAKWSFEDLIPGLSDFDTRFVVANGMAGDDWARMSLAVGAVHTEMVRAFPHWARNLEHLPGINLTAGELADPRLFYPEFQQWTFYGGDAEVVRNVEVTLGAVPWSARDELYHLKRFATFCGPYRRGIDPAVNLGPWENKYALHSRYMHYFAPPVQAAVSLVLRRNVRGKLEALRLARELIPGARVIDRMFGTLARHYEIAPDYQEPRLSELEDELERYLAGAWAALAGHVTLVAPSAHDGPEQARAKVAAVPVDPAAAFFESAKFGRLLKGRLLFYAEAIPHFDSAWLIRNELGRIVANFYERPLKLYGRVRLGGEMSCAQVLERLRGGVLSGGGDGDECDGMRRFAEVAARPIASGDERAASRRVAEVYDVVPIVLDKLATDMLAAAHALPQPAAGAATAAGEPARRTLRNAS